MCEPVSPIKKSFMQIQNQSSQKSHRSYNIIYNFQTNWLPKSNFNEQLVFSCSLKFLKKLQFLSRWQLQINGHPRDPVSEGNFT